MAALDSYKILDTPIEAEFDDIVRLAAEIFEAPIAVVNLIASGRQWFKAEIGIGARELPLDVSICAHAILQPDLLVVPDTTQDPRFADNPLVTVDGGLRFYAGAQLKTPEGLPIGTVCVLDNQVRPDGITPHQRLTLEVLARQVMSQLELRRVIELQEERTLQLREEAFGREAADAALRDLNRTLDRRVADAVAEREVVEEALRQAQKMEAIGQLTGGVAHDFNNLLTVIRGSVELLRRPNVSEDRRLRYIDAIGETAERASKLTSQLLAFARRQALRPELFDLSESLHGVMGMVSSLTGARIDLVADIPDEPCLVLADRNQFDTAIVNMTINARDAMNWEGRITIAVRSVLGVPAVRAHPPLEGEFLAVSITDSGGGISAEQMDHIFEPFYTTKAVGTGTGLGLSQVIGFAKQSGGEVRVESVLREGATFILYLPRAQPEAGDVKLMSAAEPNVTGEGVCVLVVEDNQQVGEFATQALKELGYDSVLAPDAAHALAFLSGDCKRFHIVFSDVVMPGMSGLDLGAEIRSLYPDMPIILTSGYSHVLAQNGGHDFELLHKPYSVEQLSRVIRKALAWHDKARLGA